MRACKNLHLFRSVLVIYHFNIHLTEPGGGGVMHAAWYVYFSRAYSTTSHSVILYLPIAFSVKSPYPMVMHFVDLKVKCLALLGA